MLGAGSPSHKPVTAKPRMLEHSIETRIDTTHNQRPLLMFNYAESEGPKSLLQLGSTDEMPDLDPTACRHSKSSTLQTVYSYSRYRCAYFEIIIGVR